MLSSKDTADYAEEFNFRPRISKEHKSKEELPIINIHYDQAEESTSDFGKYERMFIKTSKTHPAPD
jgi:hypothetical protein